MAQIYQLLAFISPIVVLAGSIVLALLGAGITIRHPKTAKGKWFALGGFVVVGLATVIAALIEQQGSRRLQTQIEAGVGKPVVGQKTPRTLTATDLEKIRPLLRQRGPRAIKVAVDCIASDVEGCTYAEQWLNELKAAGWQTEGRVRQGSYSTPLPRGVIIQIKDRAVPAAVDGGTLQQTFTALGIDAAGQINQQLQPDEVELLIGSN
jgi:hypothetical protein